MSASSSLPTATFDELAHRRPDATELYYRLGVVRLRVPPLAQRRDDIPQLVRYFIERAALRHHREIKQVAGPAMRVLRDYPWPGNSASSATSSSGWW